MGKFRNAGLGAKINAQAKVKPKAPTVAKKAVKKVVLPKPDTTNTQGVEAYSLSKHLRLISMLNTLKLEDQFYRSENQTMIELNKLIFDCAKEDTYLTAQCIVYSRCVGEGMRSINHAAATMLAKSLSGKEWAKRFYSLWNKKSQSGGTIFRPDDISEIVACYTALNTATITNAMKKGFKEALENMDAYSLLKYKSSLLDVINLVHPDPKKSKAKVDYNGKKVSVFEAIIKGYNVSADTWEVAQSDAGQIVSKALKEGKINKAQAEVVLKEAKSDNWKGLLDDNKLGTLAALRNIRSILSVVSDASTIDKLCEVLSDGENIRKAKVMPYQIDLAYEVLKSELKSNKFCAKVSKALLTGYEASIPNLAELLTGNNLVIVDMSGSMNALCTNTSNRLTRYSSSALDKASLIAATILKATGADIIRFGTTAEYYKPNTKQNVFDISTSMRRGMGGTSLDAAWRLAAASGKVYDRVFILSDNECNIGSSYKAYESYTKKVGDPYVYSVDLASYGTVPIAGPKVRYYYGYGTSMFDDVATSEFNPMYHLEKIKKIVI